MLFFLLPLLFQSQGICGISGDEGDFQFCATRNQTKKSNISYEIQSDGISIVNSAEKLILRAPFSPEIQCGRFTGSKECPLPQQLGPYRICLHWFRHDSLLTITYGKSQTNFNLTSQAYTLYCPITTENSSQYGPNVLYRVSYAFNRGVHNTSLPDMSAYHFYFTGDQGKTPVRVCDMEGKVRSVEEKLKTLEKGGKLGKSGRNGLRPNPFELLQRLESELGEAEFQGKNKTFGKGALLHASVWNFQSLSHQNITFGPKLEEDKEAHGFEVMLPKAALDKVVLAKPKLGRRPATPRAVLLVVSSSTLFQDQNSSDQILGGKVIGLSIWNTSVHGLLREERVALTFWHNSLPSNVTPECVFWDTGSEAGHPGKWNSSGCEAERGVDRTICRCDHLTFFAVLMVSSPEIDRSHQVYLTLITYIGCIVSAMASFFTIFFFLCTKRKQGDNIVYVHMNLLWAIFLLDMSFLIAVPLAPTGGDIACKSGAMFLHFGLLACLTWMGIEGYSLYLLVIRVFNSNIKHMLLKLCLVGWGLPLFIVLLIYVINQSHYGHFPIKVYESSGEYTNATICWITKKEINNFLNLGFLSLVLFFNTIMLGAMVQAILKLRCQWGYVMMLLGLSCVLGIPWGLAFFSFTSGTFKLVSVYLFTIINSLQGFLIFLWYLAKTLQSRRSSSYFYSTNSSSIKLQPSSTSI
uniref:Adhesion G-protein coupled receptor G1 n=1 Tax=Podarcis muralis TaxID=64176 RepID=A0A670K429_PODMU|nr:adhesion G-protein coupled receptor G1 [Podarcis muralis]XP_028595120.1 adhesion G-protein coupled receptor G1 [Podarcis muralis]XP_028595121.1 adhesion G-protein coupled receptor G1 [Podarcis muralis]XP_028595122.1 adhesion G-protein coupled receptor G1 [Podarcis muralis]XP_028595123.1 adhesion G-protein coupled receptor G1 [Podarcis muralis]XP_028595124.1 adhesion G-protein coupled receptor G1 [Podarcis muralis]